MATWTEFKQELKTSEGEITHLYLDTVGAVTVGVGNMLASAADGQKLAFIRCQTREPATKEEIAAEYEVVKKTAKGLRANAYKKHCKLELPVQVIDSLLDARIDGFKRELRQKFPKFDEYPLTAQFALLDMAFNLGTNGLVRKFPSFNKAVAAEDWEKAASESNRPQVSATRNDTVKRWLREAAKSKQ